MKKIFTSLLVALAFCTVIIAAVQTELRMHVFRNGDDGKNMFLLSEVDSVKFMNDTLESKKLYTSKFYNDGKLFATFEGCSYDSVPKHTPNRDATVAYTYTFKEWKRDESEIAKNKLTYNATYDSIIRKYAVAFLGENSEVYSLASLAYGTMPVNPLADDVKPAKASTKLNDFTFYKWTPDLTEVKADIAYRAEFESRIHPYICMFYNCDTLFKKVENCAYDYELSVDTPKHDSTDFAYEFKEWSLDTSKIARDTIIYTAVYDSSYLMRKNGAIRYAYMISDTSSVYFSHGNLQFTTQGTHKTADGTAKGTWRFAENQWNVIGDSNANIAEDYTGWIDLFGWGTSGWTNKAICYQPWSKSDKYSDYYPGGNYSNSLIGDCANADWGVYNAISNGGNEPNRWRTLTNSEWLYLFQNNRWTLGYIKTTDKDSSLCFMLIPETFIAPKGTTVKVLGKANLTSYKMTDLTVPSTNTYSTEQFASFEKLGVVALPCGGYRTNTKVFDVNLGGEGEYWSSSAKDSKCVYDFNFYHTYVWLYDNNRHLGRSVRLVQNLNLDIRFVNADGTTLLDTTVTRGVMPTYTREEPTLDSTDYAYYFKGWNKEIVEAECDMVYTAVYDSAFIMKKNGAIRYAYKISETDSVYFSQGNLQFTTQGSHKTADSTAKGIWRFAENQWDVIGDENASIAEDYTGWIDLFGWGTSGWNSKAICYQPWSKSETNSDYYPGRSYSNSLIGDYANADWGVYNAISNGGNEPNKWRTLTTMEWQYLFKNNKWTLGYIKTTDKDSTLCFMLIPETFTAPEGTTVRVIDTANLTSTSKSVTVPSTNTYSTDEFAFLEELGIVALPCGGYRKEATMYGFGSYGNYWSSSADVGDAYEFCIYSTVVYSSFSHTRSYGRSVRLVQDL